MDLRVPGLRVWNGGSEGLKGRPNIGEVQVGSPGDNSFQLKIDILKDAVPLDLQNDTVPGSELGYKRLK